jgi:hypothetical protein
MSCIRISSAWDSGHKFTGPAVIVASQIRSTEKCFVLSGCRREVDVYCALLGHYTASGGNYRRFGTNLSAPSSREDGICCPETSVRNYHYLLHNNSEKRISHL